MDKDKNFLRDNCDKLEITFLKLIDNVFENNYPPGRISSVGYLLDLTKELKKVINNELPGEVD